MYICRDRPAGESPPRRYAGGWWLVIVEEDPAIVLAGTPPRVSRRIRFRITVTSDPLHIDPMGEVLRVH